MQKGTAKRLPLVPLSPLIQTSCEYAKSLAHTTQLLSEEPSGTSSILEKDLAQQREKLDQLTKNMQSIQSLFLTGLDSYQVAKEIAYINCNLFRMVILDEKKLSNFDKQSNIIPLLDFHRYLSHAFAHMLIYGDDSSPKKSSSNSMVAQLIQIAYILLHIYRDFSGCAAIMTCLHMPEVQRLQFVWHQCPTKYLNVYKEIVAILSPYNQYEAYHHQLWLHTSRFLNTTPNKSQMIAVPFMHAHLGIIRNLVHTQRLSSPFVKDDAVEVILSESSQQALASVTRLLAFCQQHAHIHPIELEKYSTPIMTHRRLSFQSSQRSSAKPIHSIKLTIGPCSELDGLRSSPTIYHWLVSRAYLTKSQLHSESMYVAPLAAGEVNLETEQDDDDDMYWEFFEQEVPTKVVSSHSLAPAKPPKQLKDQQTVVDELVIHKPPEINKQQTSSKSDMNDNGNSNDNRNSTSSKKSTVSNTKEDVARNTETKDMDSGSKSSRSEDNFEILEYEQNKTKNMPTKTENNEESTEQNADKSKKPLLSPTAPEFVPQKLQRSLEKFNDNDDDDDVIILTEEDDEEWAGYPLDSTPSQTVADTEDDEEWTGYPITSSQEEDEEEEDEEEVWRGYPVPQEEEEDEQLLPSPISPFTPRADEELTGHSNEEWKGYQKTLEEAANPTETHVWNNNAIGKAAARRMQYSVSNVDTRKRLPSVFAPSAST
ncbi:hypothetical protein CU098_010270 [Rhizopus stolonifer]|uniref:Ras-GEF domain-containing protein n=1 Tax=Rhizopus stolonifer TaxID=4846 RepID=A0A367KF82_RHIST|nr:hypothetical protein CU098_010270 [Rhizopus stolonifer]